MNQFRPTSRLSEWRALLVALVLAAVLGVIATTPPMPRPASAPPAAFSAERAMIDVRAIAATPHVTATPENARVRAYLLQRMASLGLQTSTQQGRLDGRGVARRNRWSGRSDAAVPLVNLIGVLPGRDRTRPALMLMAHHDSVWGSPGAADDTAGVAATLEVIRALRQDGPPPRDVIVLFTDAEELGLEGARQFWASHPLRHRVGVVINMEARGGGGRTTMFQTSTQNGAAAQLYASAVRQPATSSLAAFVYSVLPNDTDLTEVLKGPQTGYNFAFIGRPGLYHSPLATPDRLDQGALQDMGAQVLDLARGLLRAPEFPGRKPDVVFFDLFGKLTVIYPTWAGWLPLAGAVLSFGLVLRRDGMRGLGRGAGGMIVLLIASAAVAYALNRLSLGLGEANYYDRLAAIPRLEGMVLCGGLATALMVFGAAAADRVRQVGAALPLLAVGLALQVWAPTAAYVVAIPLGLTALALLLPLPEVRAVLAALVVGYMLALGHQLMQGVGPGLPSAASLPLAIATLALLPVWPGSERSRPMATALMAIAIGLALWVQLDPPAESRAVYSEHRK
ncbi:M20/M25/M40 family metallo-hydrolase [Novosphingobium aerophilum]|uniref:M20/M25/M40 family metallo-hydrolase n=1 Tax=Novosphingobium aerophilum TaxID=2839843 RepID=UPI001BE4CC40|nr:M20/M25/M40 family metallo-hydrolase [Novosphingobium aerophilum]